MKCMFQLGIQDTSVLAARTRLPEDVIDDVIRGRADLDDIVTRKLAAVLPGLPEALRRMDRLRSLRPKLAPVPSPAPAGNPSPSRDVFSGRRYGSFQDALKAVLEEVSLFSGEPKANVIADLAAYIPVIPNSIYGWCYGVHSPTSDHYDCLCSVFPGLRSQPQPECIDKSKPGPKCGPTSSVPLPSYFRLFQQAPAAPAPAPPCDSPRPAEFSRRRDSTGSAPVRRGSHSARPSRRGRSRLPGRHTLPPSARVRQVQRHVRQRRHPGHAGAVGSGDDPPLLQTMRHAPARWCG